MTHTNTPEEKNTGTAWGVIALVVALLALFLGWMAYTRTNPAQSDEQTDFQDETKEALEEVRQDMALLEARARIASLAIGLKTKEQLDEARTELSNIQANLNLSFLNASAEAKAAWKKLEQDFNALQADMRSTSAATIEQIQQKLEALEKKLRFDET